ncbi:MAG: hypothetical protein ABFR90_02375 [Planctomycetota bacterium]
MEQITSQRAKWVSRTLAIISVLWALACATIFFWNHALPYASGPEIFWVGIIVSSSFSLIWIGIYVWLGVLLWVHNESKYIQRWALLPSVMSFIPLLIFFFLLIEKILNRFLPPKTAGDLTFSNMSFLTLLSIGTIYFLLKQLFFYWTKKKESVDSIAVKYRNAYFAILTLILGVAIANNYFRIARMKLSGPTDIRWFWMGPIGVILTVGLCYAFYMICFRLFIGHALKAMRQSPKDLNNGSPG